MTGHLNVAHQTVMANCVQVFATVAYIGLPMS